ncbi:MAG: hypothetical protein AAFV51_01060 [Pseudomonadota bacterium]
MRGFFSSALPGPASLVLILLRAVAGLVLIFGFSSAASEAIAEIARQPLFVDAQAPWPAFQALGAVVKGGGAAVQAAPLFLVIGLALKLFADGAASRWFARSEAGDAEGFFRSLFRDGWGRWWSMLRVSIVAGALLVGGAFIVVAGTGALLVADGEPKTALQNMQAGERAAVAILLWGAFVGAIATWMRGDLAARDGESAFISLFRGIGGLARRPFAGLIFYILAALGPTVLAGAAMIHLRAEEPTAITEGLMLSVAVAAVFAQAFFWNWTLRYAARTRVRQLS